MNLGKLVNHLILLASLAKAMIKICYAVNGNVAISVPVNCARDGLVACLNEAN